jgi:hypothetical protein
MIIYFVKNLRLKWIFASEQEYKNYKNWKIEYKNENNQLHRLDGPAIEFSDGKKCWYKNDKIHREDGPAREYNGGKEYWYNDKFIDVKTDKEFKQYIKMRLFL